jgi:uncharacterized protein (DUF2141 family)
MLLFTSIILVLVTAVSPLDRKALKITVTNIHGNGVIHLGLYKRKEEFLDFTKGKEYSINSEGKESVTFEITDADYGEYAIAVFHDMDGNGKLKTRILGIPDEPIGFSNNVKPGFGPPKFEKCKFMYDESQNSLTIRLITL